MMKKILSALVLAAMAHAVHADNAAAEGKLLNLRTEARFDWQMDRTDGTTVDSNTGFVGKYLNLRADGTIAPGLSYSWRQRFNKPHKDASFFDATDWLYLNYDWGRWSVAGGKQIVAIGGWEYDRPPIDCYGCSVFWNNITCYAVGASASYGLTPSDRLTLQFCESPFFSSGNRNLYAYNLMWNGTHGCFTALYSANMMEYAPGRYISYLALGNRFAFGRVALELDVMNRAASHQQFLLKDMSVMAEVQYRPAGKWNIFGKFTYDVNRSGTAADMAVPDGTELKMAGAGVEFMPLSNARHLLRLHAVGFYSWGVNANAANMMQDRTFTASVGVTWYMNLLSFKR